LIYFKYQAKDSDNGSGGRKRTAAAAVFVPHIIDEFEFFKSNYSLGKRRPPL